MNDFEPKRERALEILAATGMWRSSYAPPIYHLLWRCGWELRPPHFASAGVNFAFCSGFFALGLTLLKLALPWGRDMTIEEVLLGGIAFGCSMALYYAIGRRCYTLPRWEQLPRARSGARTAGRDTE
jgi:hypothetical protein